MREPATGAPAHTFDSAALRTVLEPRYLGFALVLVLAWTCFQGIDGLVTFSMSSELGASGTQIGLYGTLKGVGILVGGIGFAAVGSVPLLLAGVPLSGVAVGCWVRPTWWSCRSCSS